MKIRKHGETSRVMQHRINREWQLTRTDMILFSPSNNGSSEKSVNSLWHWEKRGEKVNPSWRQERGRKKIPQHYSNLTAPSSSHVSHFWRPICFLHRRADTLAHALKCQEEVVSGGKHPSGRGSFRLRQRERTPALDIQVDLLDLERLSVRRAEQGMRQDYPGRGRGELIACTLTLVHARPGLIHRGWRGSRGPGSKCPHNTRFTPLTQ